MAKATPKVAKPTPKYGPFLLEFMGSLIFLWVIFSVASVAYVVPPLFSGATLWFPFFVAGGALASIALFFLSFGLAMDSCSMMTRKAKKALFVAGFTLLALTWYSTTYMFATIIAIMLAYVGLMMAHKCCSCECECGCGCGCECGCAD